MAGICMGWVGDVTNALLTLAVLALVAGAGTPGEPKGLWLLKAAYLSPVELEG
jgi:hypothetical protein